MTSRSRVTSMFRATNPMRGATNGHRSTRSVPSRRSMTSLAPVLPLLPPVTMDRSGSRIPFSSSSKSSDVTEKSLDPYVDPIYSYSFGRSTGYLEYKTIGRRLDEMADKYPDHVAVISSHQSISRTYSQLNDEVHRLAKSLHDMMGIKRGDVIGIWSANVYEYILMQFAILRIGAIACAISPLCKSPELSHILRKGKVKALAFPGPQSLQNFVIDYAGILTAAEKPFLTDIIQMDGADDEADCLFPDLKSHSMQKLLAASSGKLDEEILQSVSPDDVASIFFTSGTTGKPKGAATSHTTMLNSQRSINVNKRQIREDSGCLTCVPLPLFHAFAGMGVINTFLVIACTYVIPGYKFTVAETVNCMNEQKCTDLSAVPSMIIDIMNYCKENRMTIQSLKSILLGAANAPEHVVSQLYDVFPNLETVIVAYGCTETSPVATYPNHDLPQSEMNRSVGTVIDFGSAKIVDPVTSKLLKHNETGELHVKGMLMHGYWDEEEKTAEVMRNGWYATGDLGIMDQKGLIRITGRTKELIIRGGANIYPKEVEDLLHQHDNVLTVAVCGVPHDRLGEEVCAWIKLKDASRSTTQQEIQSFCKERISYYKIPKHVFFVDSFPMTASGKFQKYLMTEQSIQMIHDLKSFKQSS